MATQAVGIPTTRGVMHSMKDFGVGALAGMGYGVATGIFGSSILGLLIVAGLVGAMVKGSRGETIATMAGFLALMTMFGAGAAAAPAGAGEM